MSPVPILAVAPSSAANPADPFARVPPAHYESITAGTRSYRPVEPLPWGDVNRRVAPPGALPPAAAPRTPQPEPPEPAGGQKTHRH